jgi:hypothetical protein
MPKERSLMYSLLALPKPSFDVAEREEALLRNEDAFGSYGVGGFVQLIH